MVPTSPRLRILSVGGNAVSAFLSWRLQATNCCDVTLVWKSGFDTISQYGISFKSTSFGTERFKPRSVVRTPEEATSRNNKAFDFVLVCVKALPDVYDLASIIEPVVTPKQTCIVINTTNTLGVEAQLEPRFPTNIVLSLVSGAEITQLGASEFEHKGSTEIWLGPANKQPNFSSTAQVEMAEALAMTLSSGQINCHVTQNIRQQQYERMIGVIFDTPSHALLIEKVGVRAMITGIIDELLSIATAQKCTFPLEFKKKTIEEMTRLTDMNSSMFQDFAARRPMEVETYLGSPIKLAQSTDVHVPRIETLYAILHNLNINNQLKKDVSLSSPITSSSSRLSVPSASQRGLNGGQINGPGPGGRGRGRAPIMNGSQPILVRRAPPPNTLNVNPLNGHSRPIPSSNGTPQRNLSRRGSLEGNDLEEFSHLVLYDDIPESGEVGNTLDANQIALRERELALRQRELALREHEMRLKISSGPRSSRRAPKTPSIRNGGFDDDDEDDYFDPADGPPVPLIDPDNFDMMSVTSRRNRKAALNPREIRKNPEMGDIVPTARRSNGFSLRQGFSRNRSSARVTSSNAMPLHMNLMDDNLLGYSSNRYGNVDRAQMGLESRSNSLTAARLDELQSNGSAPVNSSYQRRTSNLTANFHNLAGDKTSSRKPSPPNGFLGAPTNRRPSPSTPMMQSISRHTSGPDSAVSPHHVEQYAGVSAHIPSKGPSNIQSLTGSASASAGSTDSANNDSEPSASSSQSSLGHRPPIGVR